MSTKLDPAIPLCNDCYKDSAFAVTPESKSKYVAKLIKKNLTKTNLLQLGFSVIDTPYSGLCSWEGVALSILYDNPVYFNNPQSYQRLCLRGVMELLQLTFSEKNLIPKKTKLGKVLEVCMYLII